MQGDGPVAPRRAQPSIYRRTLIAEVFDELESKQIAVEAESLLHVFNVYHGVVEGKLSVSVPSGGSLRPWRPNPLSKSALPRARIRSLFRRDSPYRWLLHGVVS